jgi:hypothetical protein
MRRIFTSGDLHKARGRGIVALPARENTVCGDNGVERGYADAERFGRNQWPGTPILSGETPAAFEGLVRAGLAYLNQRPAIPPVLTIGRWNECTEGRYLLPDTKHGFGMLRSVARALGRA